MTAEIVGGNVFEFTTEIANLVETKSTRLLSFGWFGELELNLPMFCVCAALAKTSDTGKYGVGYFQPDNCDHDKVECVFKPYPEYKNLKQAYTTTKNSTIQHDSYTPTRDAILSCPKKMSIELPPTPKGELYSHIVESGSLVEITYHVDMACLVSRDFLAVPILECTITQPVCNGVKANSYEHITPSKSKRSPSNKESDDPSITKATQGSSNEATTTTSATALLLSVAAVAVTALTVF